MKKISLSLIALVALAVSNFAAAQQSQAYVGLQVGTSRANLDCSGFSTCDKTDTAYKVYGGYKLTPQWAIELGYTDFGKIKLSDPVESGDVKTNSLGVGAAFLMPFNNDWSGTLRFGIASDETKVSGSLSGSDSERKTKPYVGLGVGYALNKQITVTGNWDWTEGEFRGDKAKYNTYSVGVNFAF
jgi:OmpA-OmpF porin, OOP family